MGLSNTPSELQTSCTCLHHHWSSGQPHRRLDYVYPLDTKILLKKKEVAVENICLPVFWSLCLTHLRL